MKNSFTILLTIFLTACGGSGSSNSAMLIEGTLTQGDAVGHEDSAQLRHSAGEHIENVLVCALGECSTTDSEGQWGIVAPDSFAGGAVLFSISGHGIDTQAMVTIPLDVEHVVVGFVRQGDQIVAESIDVHDDDEDQHSH